MSEISNSYQYDPSASFTSPDQNRAQNDYAKAMLYGHNQQPVKHWTQGLSNMVNALMGGRMMYDAGQKERMMRQGFGRDAANAFPGQGGTPPPGPTQGAALPSPPDQAQDQPQASASPSQTALPPASSPQADSPFLGFARAPLMKELEANPTLKNELFRRAAAENPQNPSEFIQSVTNRYLARKADYDRKGGFMAAVSEAGYFPKQSLRGSPYNQRAAQFEDALKNVGAGGDTIQKGTGNASLNVGFGYGQGAGDPYTYRTPNNERYGVENNPQDRAFAAQAADFDANMPTQEQSIQRALAPTGPQGTPQAGMTAKADVQPSDKAAQFAQALSKKVPAPGGTPTIEPDVLRPNRPSIERDAMARMIANPYARPEILNYMFGQYTQQGRPQEVEYGPGKFIFDPRTGAKRWDSPIQEEVIKGPEGMEQKIPYRWFPDPSAPGGFRKQFLGSGTAGGTGPSSATPSQAAPDVGPPDLNLPKRNSVVPIQQAEAPGGMLGTVPPPADEGAQQAATPTYVPPRANQGPAPTTPGTVPTAPIPAPSQTEPTAAAGANAPSWLPPEVAEKQEYMKQEGLDYAKAKEYDKKDMDLLTATHNELQKGAASAIDLRTSLERMQSLVQNPKFPSGSAAGLRTSLDTALYTMGLSKGETATLAQEFDKLRSTSVLTNLRAFVAQGGLGRVLQSEIGLFNQAMADKHNTAEANRAVLELNIRASDHLDMMAKISDGYSHGYRVGPDGNWAKNKVDPRSGTNTDLRANINNWLRAHPLLDKDEIKHFENVFKADKEVRAEQEQEQQPVQGKKPWQGIFAPTPSGTPEEAKARKLEQLKKQ